MANRYETALAVAASADVNGDGNADVILDGESFSGPNPVASPRDGATVHSVRSMWSSPTASP